jgi:hypothetical protein
MGSEAVQKPGQPVLGLFQVKACAGGTIENVREYLARRQTRHHQWQRDAQTCASTTTYDDIVDKPATH